MTEPDEIEASAEEAPQPTNIGSYVITNLLGRGSFATVYSAYHSVTLAPVALKCVAKSSLQTQEDFILLQREVSIMKKLDHPFIATLYEVLDDDIYIYIAIELIEDGSLLDYINSNGGLSEPQARRLFIQLISALHYLHESRHIVHRDLKAENILLDRFMNIRLIDFGLSKSFTNNDPFLQTTCGSPAYLSPEIIQEKPYTCAADVWSAGVLLYAMVVGMLPFNGESIGQMLQNILTTDPMYPPLLSKSLSTLIQRMLTKDSNERITIPEIMEHPWVKECQDAIIFSQEFGLLDAIKVASASEVDQSVISEMRMLGYDTTGLQNEIKADKINTKTAAYKMLRRQRSTEEVNAWQKMQPRMKKSVSERDTLPALSAVKVLFNQNEQKKATDQSPRSSAQQIRGRVMNRRMPNTQPSPLKLRRKSLVNGNAVQAMACSKPVLPPPIL